METGWIKLHRKLLEWEWADDPNMVALWIHLLLNANFEDSKWHGRIIPRGSFLTSQSELCTKTGLTRRSLRTCLTRLKSTNEVTIETTKRHSIITVCKYDSYQFTKDSQRPSERPTSDQQATNPINIVEEDKELEEYLGGIQIDIHRYGEEWTEIIGQWMFYKFANGNPYKTQASVNLLAKQLSDLSGGNVETARSIINQSMANNWSGLFPLKESQNSGLAYKGDQTLGTYFQRKQ